MKFGFLFCVIIVNRMLNRIILIIVRIIDVGMVSKIVLLNIDSLLVLVSRLLLYWFLSWSRI